MPGIVFPALYLDREYLPIVFNYKIKLSQLLAVVVVKRITMSVKLLSYNIFINGTFV